MPVDENEFKDMDSAFEQTGSMPDPTEADVSTESGSETPAETQLPMPADVPKPSIAVPVEKQPPAVIPQDMPTEEESTPPVPGADADVKKVVVKEEEVVVEKEEKEEEKVEQKEEGAVAQLKAAQAEVARLSAQLGPKAASVQTDAPAAPGKPLQFVANDEELSDTITDVGKLNDLLGRVVGVSIQAIAPITQRIVAQQLETNNLVMGFWMKNQDLGQFRQYVGTVAEEIEAANPGMSMAEIFENTGKVSRERLQQMGHSLVASNAAAPAVPVNTVKAPVVKKPVAPLPVRVGAGVPPTAPVLSDFEAQVAEMDKAAGIYNR